MEEKIKKFKELQDSLKGELRLWVVDKSIPLEERWKVFIDSKLGDYKSFIERFNCVVGEEYIDTLETKYSTEDVEQILEWAEDEDENSYTPEDIIEFKENVLKKFIYSFQFDW